MSVLPPKTRHRQPTPTRPFRANTGNRILGCLDVALDLAATNQWTDRRHEERLEGDISLPRTVSGGSVTQFDKRWHPSVGIFIKSSLHS
jgi:hypothetical protein